MEQKYSFEQVEELITSTHKYENNQYSIREEFLTELNSLFREMKIAIIFDDTLMCNSVIDQWVNRFENYWYVLEEPLEFNEEM